VSTSRLTAADGALAAIGVVSGLIVVAIHVLVVPSFADMFADFGGPLPTATKLALMPWFGLAVALDTMAFVAVGILIRIKSPKGPGRILLALAIAQGIGAIVFLIYALYAPIFTLADRIAP
jgi:type II secretory pathway component PulF